jgi:Lar family restriction alleviation protein
MNELLNCPFCGSNNVRYRYQCGARFVTCDACEAYGPMVRGEGRQPDHKEIAISKWNSRASHLTSNSLHANSCSCQEVANVSDTTNHLPSGSPAP